MGDCCFDAAHPGAHPHPSMRPSRAAPGASPVRASPRLARARRVAARASSSSSPRRRGAGLLLDPYRVLGVADDAAPEEVQLAYRRLAKTWHPDVNPAPGAAARFRRVNAAYEILGDPSRRDAFDRGLLDDRARTVDDDVAFAPSARTRRAANERAYGGDGRDERDDENASARARARARARRRDGAPGGSDAAVAPMDEARRERALRSMTAKKIASVWTAWCRGWFAALQLGVPAACGYWILRATAAEELARRGAEDLAPWLARVGG